ncbi:MAG TPA: RNA pseudouridine synthase, partial [Pirellulaceae bacterium]
MKRNSKSLVIESGIPLPGRTLLAIVRRLLGTNPGRARKVITTGRALVNSKRCLRAESVLQTGDRVELLPEEPPRPRPASSGRTDSVHVLFEDDLILVVEKPPRMLTVPTPHREKNTLISKLNTMLGRREGGGEAFCVHRLDRDVSGILVFAKSLDIARALRDQFASRKPQRRYQALVAGTVHPQSGTFRSHMATDRDLNRYSVPDESSGELAITHYEVLRSGSGATLVEVQLETGRRNQIRVHFAEAGHPILGETRY